MANVKNIISDNMEELSYQGASASVVPSFSAIEKLRFIKQSDGSCSYISDQYLLLNQERIRNALGDDTFRSIMNSFNQQIPPSHIDIPEEYQLMSVRSRFIQAPSEIAAWISELSDKSTALKDKLDSDLAAYVESLKQSVSKSSSELSSSSSSSDSKPSE